MNNLKSIWSITDKDLIESMKYEGQNKRQEHEKKDFTIDPCLQRNSAQKGQNTGYGSDYSECMPNSKNQEHFVAIPKEFRPNKPTKDLLPISLIKDTSVPIRYEGTQSYVSELCTDRCLNDNNRNIRDDTKDTKRRLLATKSFRALKSDEMKSKRGNLQNTKSNLIPEANREIEDKRTNERDEACASSSKILSKTFEKKGKTLREEFLEVSFTRKTLHPSSELNSEKQLSEDCFQSLEKQLKACKLSSGDKPRAEKVIEEKKSTKSNVGNEHKRNVDSYKTQNVKWNPNLCIYEENYKENKISFQYVSMGENGEKNFTTAVWERRKQRMVPCTTKGQHCVNKAVCDNEFITKTESGSRFRNIKFTEGISPPIKVCFSPSVKSKKRDNEKKHKNAPTQVRRHEIGIVHVNKPKQNSINFGAFSKMDCEEEKLNSITTSENEDHDSSEKNRYWEETSSKKILNSPKNKYETDKNIVGKQSKSKIESSQKSPRTEKRSMRTKALNMSGQAHVNHSTNQQYMFPSSATETGHSDAPWNILFDNEQPQMSLLIQYGREISDIIAKSHMKMRAFLSFYDGWLISRDETIHLLEQLAENVSNLSKKNCKISDVIGLVSGGANVIATVPIGGWQITAAGKVIAALSSVFWKIFQASPSLNDSGLKESQMMRHLQEDIEATSAVYMYASQCDQQFQYACRLIEEFQQNINDGRFDLLNARPECIIFEDLKGFNPKNSDAYYKRLYKCFENLRKHPSSEICKAFCSIFEGSSDGIATIKQLQWRFNAQITDNETVKRAWDDICMFFQDSDSKCCKMLLDRIQNCLKALLKERCSIKNNVKELMLYKN